MEDPATEPAAGMELRRIRTASWRIVYVVEEADERITVLAVRKRPPYQYDDLDELLGNL
jgi:mRNA interferase RelE/StbE